ncbi:MAG: tetratricopeptide repeat protein [Casimicrobium sp.]|jgi:Ca-activated chloride channel family protein
MKCVSWTARSAVAALLMTGTALTLAASAIASADAPTASLWSRLWRTPDQRGQALLQQGDAAGAARAFVDPQRKAHAALQAHDYTAAAQTLTGIDTAEAHYNRGNALAHTGDLQGAIGAYDAALKHNPQHTDARHNREVVAAALQKQETKDESKQDKQQQSKEGSKPGDKADEKQDAKDGKSDGKPGDKADGKQDAKDGKSDGKPREKADGKQDAKDGKSDAKPSDKSDGKQNGQDGKSEPKPSDKSAGKQDGNDSKPADKAKDTSGSKPGEKSGQKQPDQPGPSPSGKPGERSDSAPQPATASASTAAAPNPKDDAAQARRDAESALGKGAQPSVPSQTGASTATQRQPAAADAARVPLTEKQIAQEQWLRAIPDDPGGLLRRKFLIEHMLRQQGQKP